MEPIPFYRPYKFDISEGNMILSRTKRILQERAYTAGYHVDLFESKLEVYFNVDHAILCNSGTTAFLLILKVLDHVWRIGIPIYTWKSIFNMAKWCERIIYPLDINQQTWCLDTLPEMLDLEMIVPTHTYGNIVDFSPIPILDTHVVYDASHIWGKTPPDIGTATFLSMHGAKTITTAGEGGVILTNDDNLAKKIRDIQTYFGNITEIQAMIGMYYFNCLGEIVKAKKEVWEYYADMCGELGGIPQQVSIDHAYGYFGCLFPDPIRLGHIKMNAKKNMVEIRQYYHPITPIYRHGSYVANHTICLPCYPGVNKEEVIRRLSEEIQ